MKRLMRKSSGISIIYAGEDLPKNITKSIFLAGPTPRSKDNVSWRKEAIELFKKLGYDGTIFIPEAREGKNYPEYNKQIEWEQQMLDACDCILFWIPRNMKTLPALTTNIEWGKYQNSAKVVVGFPEDSEHNRYIKYECEKLQIDVNNSLEDTIESAIRFVGNGAYRENGECYIPLNIWSTDMFQKWYSEQKNVGNILESARVNYIFKMPKAQKVFLWILYVKIFIKNENRYKENEFVVSRTDISSIVMYKKDEKDILNSDIILIKEFRSPGSTHDGYVHELPGGSSIDEKDNIDVISDEVFEEVGVRFDNSRFKFEESRQIMATLCSHKCHLYSIELTDNEFELIKNESKNIHGVKEDSELTYIEIKKIKEIINDNLVDWSNIGYILYVLNKK